MEERKQVEEILNSIYLFYFYYYTITSCAFAHMYKIRVKDSKRAVFLSFLFCNRQIS
jgi:hypothetical protein